MLSARAERMLHYPRAALFELAADVEQYPQYLGGWISARVYARQADVWYAEQALGFGPVRIQFRSRAELHRPERIEVSSDDPQFRCFRLLWRFEPHQGGDCLVALSVDLDLRARLLQSALERLGATAARDALLAFERRARQVCGNGPRRLQSRKS